MGTLFYNLLIFYILFQGVLSNSILGIVLGYWDEFAFFAFILYFIAYKQRNNGILRIGKSNFDFMLPWMGVLCIGMLGNIVFGYSSSLNGIARDIVGCMKFFVVFFCIRETHLDRKIYAALKKTNIRWLELITLMIFVCCIVSLFFDIGMSSTYEKRFGIYPFQFLFSHPTGLVFVCVSLICLFNALDIKPIYNILLLIVLACTMRTKAFAFIAVYIFLKYMSKLVKRAKILYWIFVFIVAFAVGYDKLLLYQSFSSSGREVLWRGAFQLLAFCFPLGSGFGTYASHVSGRYGSSIYNFINSSDFFWADGTPQAVLGDTGFPYYIGQFGIIGIVLIAISVIKLRKMISDKVSTFPIDMYMIYIGIALTSESTLVNQGVEAAFVLSLLYYANSIHSEERNG